MKNDFIHLCKSVVFLLFLGGLLAQRECCISRKNKTENGGNNYEKLIRCETENGAESLKNAAIIRNDGFLMAEIGNLEECQIIN